jgi:radical SAM superfamily enzyme YgiQ (UPF0313 family)
MIDEIQKEIKLHTNKKEILLAAVNAKYIHSNLAIRYLALFDPNYTGQVELREYTINQLPEKIIADIFQVHPKILCFSCYIWNWKEIQTLVRWYRQIDPDVVIWLGGPEVSFHGEEILKQLPETFGIMTGEGEYAFAALERFYLGETGTLKEIPGLIFRDGAEICHTGAARIVDMDELPFVYQDMDELKHKIPYYETSRGCPFACSYCLSSLAGVRFRSMSLVQKELQFFLDARIPQVKFVDRTFNCNHQHAQTIWTYLRDHDNGVTNFHFEIAADLLNDEEIQLLSELRPGQVQLEIGVQSTNEETIREIDRVQNIHHLAEVVSRIHQGQNIHQHLDLIAGLPYENFQSFLLSFDSVYAMNPQQLQMGFLKVLKGSRIEKKAKTYGIVYAPDPPYEVIRTNWISYEEILCLKQFEEMLETYGNSHQFDQTIRELEHCFSKPSELYLALAGFYQRHNLWEMQLSRLQKFDLLREFCLEIDPGRLPLYEECLLMDLYLRENSKTRPAWGKDLKAWREAFRKIYQQEAEERNFLETYERYDSRQMSRMTHAEVFCRLPNPNGTNREKTDEWIGIYDYRQRDPLTGNAILYGIPLRNGQVIGTAERILL